MELHLYKECNAPYYGFEHEQYIQFDTTKHKNEENETIKRNSNQIIQLSSKSSPSTSSSSATNISISPYPVH